MYIFSKKITITLTFQIYNQLQFDQFDELT